MICQISPNDSFTVVMGGAATTTNPTYSAAWKDQGALENPVGSLEGATAVTVVDSPPTGKRTITMLRIYNKDTADATVTISKVASSTTVNLAKVTIPAGDHLLWDEAGMRIVNASGQVQQGTESVSGVGAAAGTGVAATEEGNNAVHKTTLTFTNAEVALTDEAGVVAYGGLKVYDFPEGAIQVLGAVLDVDLTKDAAGVNDDWDGDVSVGSVTASNNATLTSTEADVIPSTATPQATAGETTANAQSTITEAGTVLDGTTTAKDLYVNLLVDDADHNVAGTPTNLILNGTLTVHWLNLGDY